MKVLKCGTATPSCSDAWTQESSRLHSHLPEPRPCALGVIADTLASPRGSQSQHCALGSSRIHSHRHEARNAFASVLCPRVIADTLASPRTFANAHHSHFLFTVTRHSSATSPQKRCMASVSPDTPRIKNSRLHRPVRSDPCLSRVFLPSPDLATDRRPSRRARSLRGWPLLWSRDPGGKPNRQPVSPGGKTGNEPQGLDRLTGHTWTGTRLFLVDT